MTEEDVLAQLASLEATSGVSPGLGDSETCETGDEYVEIVATRSGKPWVDEGVTKRDPTPEMAWRRWFDLFRRYQEPRGGTIHWRVRPEMTDTTDPVEYPEELGYTRKTRGFCVYSRLFVEEAA